MIQRKNADGRKEELRLAILRIEKGRSRTKASKLSISAVAREAGVTPALIHNHYPAIAEQIRIKQGASSRLQRDEKQNKLRQEREKTKALRLEITDMTGRIVKLASINEMLLLENRALKSKLGDSKVVNLIVDSPANRVS